MAILPDYILIKNRSKLKELLLPYSLVVLSSNRVMLRSGDQNFPFRQSSDMYYLTGIKQDKCTLIIFPEEGPDKFGEVLYIPEEDGKAAIWDGPRLSLEDAHSISGVQEVRYLKELNKDLKDFIAHSRVVYFGNSKGTGRGVFQENEFEIRQDPALYFDSLDEHLLAPLMTRLRMYKEPEEIELMKKAISITGDAFIRVLKDLQPGMKEYEIEALLTYEFQSRGAKEHAFDPIVASGKNALILHYLENRSTCKKEDLLLLDFGADWEYYAADVSRTIPVCGHFSARQLELYEANLNVLQKAMNLMRPGILIRELNREVGNYWEEEHIKLGLYTMAALKMHTERSPLWNKYYWHGTSHSIGIDVHDPFDQTAVLQAGMVMSCEPGIYIPEEGVGIRLENDILITAGAPVNLSASIPIEADEIEALMNSC